MKQNIIIRRFEEGDEEQVNVLLTDVFDDWKGKEYWLWKYKDNPAGYRQNIWLAEDNGKIVSYGGIIPTIIKIGDETVLGAQLADTATYPDYRRKGLFQSLRQKTITEAFADGIQVMFGFPGGMSYGGHINKLGAHDLGSIPKHYRILKPGNILTIETVLDSLKKLNPCNIYRIVKSYRESLHSKYVLNENLANSRPLINMLLLFAIVISNPRCLFRLPETKEIPDLVINVVSSFDERITSFWKEISKQFPIAIDRNNEYLNWRYTSGSWGTYIKYLAENKGRIDGYMVLKTEQDKGIIMDIISRDNQVFACLLDRALRYFKNERKAIVECWMLPDYPYSKMLRKYGFGSWCWVTKWLSRLGLMNRSAHPFIVYINTQNNGEMQQKLLHLNYWFMAAGDTDKTDFSYLIL